MKAGERQEAGRREGAKRSQAGLSRSPFHPGAPSLLSPCALPALTQEADEAFGVIEYALEQQLGQLEGAAAASSASASSAGAGGGADGTGAPAEGEEFRRMWLDTLGDTRAGFLELVGGPRGFLELDGWRVEEWRKLALAAGHVVAEGR